MIKGVTDIHLSKQKSQDYTNIRPAWKCMQKLVCTFHSEPMYILKAQLLVKNTTFLGKIVYKVDAINLNISC